jgi:hypothetical protein
MASEAIAESVGREIASAESAAPSEIVTTPVVCEAGMPNGMGPKLMCTGEVAQTSPAMDMGAGKVPDTPKMAAAEVAAAEVPTTEVPPPPPKCPPPQPCPPPKAMTLLGSEIATIATLAMSATMILRDMTLLLGVQANPQFTCLVGFAAGAG